MLVKEYWAVEELKRKEKRGVDFSKIVYFEYENQKTFCVKEYSIHYYSIRVTKTDGMRHFIALHQIGYIHP